MPPTLLTLPLEVRHQILTYVLHINNNNLLSPTTSLNTTEWARETRYKHALTVTQACQQLRYESIKVFYETNAFHGLLFSTTLSLVQPDLSDTLSPFPLKDPKEERHVARALHTGRDAALPFFWRADVLYHLRNLRVKILLQQWDSAADLKQQLSALIFGLDFGVRMQNLHIQVASRDPEVGEWSDALRVLGELRVSGELKVVIIKRDRSEYWDCFADVLREVLCSQGSRVFVEDDPALM